MGIRLLEHRTFFIEESLNGEEVLRNDSLSLNSSRYALFKDVVSKRFNNSSHCFSFLQQKDNFLLEADYCIGLDWLGLSSNYYFPEG